MADEKPTREEIEMAREKRRGNALKNLKAFSLLNLATAYLTQSDKNYGEHDNGSVEEFLYKPSLRNASSYDLESGEESSLVYDSLLGSREDGRRYSGQVSEYGTIKTGAVIVQQSLAAIKVKDLMGLVGSGLTIDTKAVQNRYIFDLIQSENEEDKKLAHNLIGGYMQYLATQGVSSALGLKAAAIRGGLEKLVSTPKK